MILDSIRMSVPKQIRTLYITLYNARNFPQMHAVFDDSEASVLFQAIHVLSPRKKHPAVSQNRNPHAIL